MTSWKIGMAAVFTMAGVQAMAQEAAPPQTMQQMFDAAYAASNAGEHEKAASLLAALAQRAKNPRTLAIIRLRQGMALGELSRWNEARPLLEQALAALPEGDATLNADRRQALNALGRLALYDLDYETARDLYRKSAALADDPAEKVSALLGEAQAGAFVDPAEALAKAEEAERLIAREPALVKSLGAYATALRGRALLNLGRFAEAETAFAATVKAEGGLSLKVNYDDLVARSDASIAAMMAGHRDKARNYLVYTGAGRMEKQDFTFGADMVLPTCGEDGIRPDDVAIVEFGIKDDGGIAYARPAYGSRQGGMALVFARAVKRWSWRPEDVEKIPALQRLVTRLELRCSTSQGGPALIDGVRSVFRDWIEQHGISPFDPVGDTETKRRASMDGELARLRAIPGSKPLAQAGILAMLLENPLVMGKSAQEYSSALKAIVEPAAPPPMVRLWADWLVAMNEGRNARSYAPVKLSPAAYAADPVAHVTVQLMNYDQSRLREKQRGLAVLDAIIADPALAKDHPLRVAALVRRASARAAAKDIEGARADYQATGMTDQQCSIVDAKPGLRSASISEKNYPTDMVRVGVEGWTRIEHDIASDGSTINQRAVVSYPPMIFSKNGVGIVTNAKYEQSYRPQGSMGCQGSNMNITFRMPG